MYSDTAKNEMLDGLTVDRVIIHSGDPGSDGSANQESGLVAATFAAASAGARALSSQVNFTGLTPSVACTWFSVWENTGSVFKGRGQITTGDTAANANGDFSLTTATQLTLSDS